MKKAFWGPAKYQPQFLVLDLLGPRQRHLVFPDLCEDFGRRQWRCTRFSLPLYGVSVEMFCVFALSSPFHVFSLVFSFPQGCVVGEGTSQRASSFHFTFKHLGLSE